MQGLVKKGQCAWGIKPKTLLLEKGAEIVIDN